MQIAPKEDELRAFQAYEGTYDELSPPEQFLYTMASVPRLNDKINVLILMHQFEVNHSALECTGPPLGAWQASILLPTGTFMLHCIEALCKCVM